MVQAGSIGVDQPEARAMRKQEGLPGVTFRMLD
jgi:hypothetical protein